MPDRPADDGEGDDEDWARIFGVIAARYPGLDIDSLCLDLIRELLARAGELTDPSFKDRLTPRQRVELAAARKRRARNGLSADDLREPWQS